MFNFNQIITKELMERITLEERHQGDFDQKWINSSESLKIL
jgi:hypothetical protein